MSISTDIDPIEFANQSLANERFGFTLFMSLCAHAVLILGVGFTFYEQLNTPSSLEVTLAQYESDEAPENADFLAQANQEGSGSQDELARPSSPFESRFNADVIQEVAAFETETVLNNSEREILTSIDSNSRLNAEEEIQNTPQSQDFQGTAQNSLDQTLASLQAQLDIHREAYAQRPRKYTISSASTQQARDALYLDGWRRKIEAVGNFNYPQQASAAGIYGQLRLMVALFPDGRVSEVRILSTSGQTVLDDAAIRIVQLAAPFDPFPADMREDVDILEIVRTWQFHQSNTFTSN
ncbi:MAG: energy transducer TonB [Gammaproteobacteria bacterium]|nr:energy transducer TonB [Gammaproteobacteria bacterium]